MLANPPPNIPEEDWEVAEVVELLVILPNAGGAVVGGADAANPPPKVVAGEVVMAEPNEGADDVAVVVVVAVVDPKPNFGTTDTPKVGFDADAVRAGAPDAAPPNVNALVVEDGVVVVTAAEVVMGGFKFVPNVNPPPEVVAVPPEVEATTLPNDGRLEALVMVTEEEPVGESGLNALNPEPLPKVAMVD